MYYFYQEDTYLYNQNTSISLDRFLEEGVKLEHVSEADLSRFLYDGGKKMNVLPEQSIEAYLTQKFRSLANKTVIYDKTIESRNTSTMLFWVGDTYNDNLLKNEDEDLR